MKRVSKFKRVQNLFVLFYRLGTKILNDPVISFVYFINCNEFLLKKIVYLDLEAYKKDISQFLIYYLVLNCIQYRFGFTVRPYGVVSRSSQSEKHI